MTRHALTVACDDLFPMPLKFIYDDCWQEGFNLLPLNQLL
jgi:hypothetical protein